LSGQLGAHQSSAKGAAQPLALGLQAPFLWPGHKALFILDAPCISEKLRQHATTALFLDQDF